jgi:hypothetical protein
VLFDEKPKHEDGHDTVDGARFDADPDDGKAGGARRSLPHGIDLQNGYPISKIAPNCVATKRLQWSTNQLRTLGVKTVSVGRAARDL